MTPLCLGVPEKIEEVVKVKGRDGAIDVLTRYLLKTVWTDGIRGDSFYRVGNCC